MYIYTVDPHYSEFICMNWLTCQRLFVTLRSILEALSQCLAVTKCRAVKERVAPCVTFPAELEHEHGSVSVLRLNSLLLMAYLVTWLLHFLPFLLVILMFKMALRHSATMLSGLPKAQDCSVPCEKNVLDKLCSEMSYL